MSTLILVHVVTSFSGIAAGLTAVGGMYFGRQMGWMNAVFLWMTAEACATGFVFLPDVGLTSSQLVVFFVTFLLIVAAYTRYMRRLDGSWNQVRGADWRTETGPSAVTTIGPALVF